MLASDDGTLIPTSLSLANAFFKDIWKFALRKADAKLEIFDDNV